VQDARLRLSPPRILLVNEAVYLSCLMIRPTIADLT